MGVVVPWTLLMVLQAYKHGIAPTKADGSKLPPQMPEPYYFFWGSAIMGFAAVVAMANARFGTVLAYGFLIGAMVYTYSAGKANASNLASNSNPSSSGVKNAGKPQIAAIPQRKGI